MDLIFSFLITLALLWFLLNTSLRGFALDKPNARSLHVNLTPRTGGLAIMAGTVVTWLFIGVSWLWLALLLVLMGVSLLDDMRGLKARWRFLSHVTVCAIFLWAELGQFPLWTLATLLFAMVWMVNLYNFMDGSDGLAGGMAVFGFGAYGIAAYLALYPEMAMVCAALVGANLAFLVFNFHPARIFMGDSGSIPQGFLAAALGLWGWQQNIWPLWFPLLVFSPFIVDASVTLIKRVLRRERIWEAHKSHYYQRLVQMGWGHKGTAIAEYGLMLAVVISGLSALAVFAGAFSFVIGFWLLLYTAMLVYIDIAWRRYKRLNPH